MKTTNFLISEESVGHPDLAAINQRQIFDLICKVNAFWWLVVTSNESDESEVFFTTFIVVSKLLFELQSFIIPFLPQCDLKLVFLKTHQQ